MPIQILPIEVSSRIAAGEVIERPGSVVKELVENALDAGATSIEIEVLAGGVELIRVVDNGRGIPGDEVELAVERFATSKLRVSDELGAIGTLGFRGEALSSIAAVSRLDLVSRPADQENGTGIEVVDSHVTSSGPRASGVGSTVAVKDLFRNFPVRRKFLRTPGSETGRIQLVVTRYALAYPEVRFRLTVDGSEVFASVGSGVLREAVAAVYTRQTAEAMLELEVDEAHGSSSEIEISGLTSPPSLDRANRTFISLFVNRRWVQSRVLAYAIEQAYHGFIKERRYPLAVVNVTVPLDEVDVNVHPAKSEVRFRHENRVFGALQQTVRHTLTTHAPVPEFRPHSVSPRTPAAAPGRPVAGPHPAFWPTQVAPPAQPPGSYSQQEGPGRPSEAAPAVGAPAPRGVLPVLRVLGQVQETYIVAEGPDGMYLVDQHAAHERILFEEIRAGSRSVGPRAQSVLEPAVVELDARRQELVEEQGELISRMGFEVGPFGERSYVVRAVPRLLGEADTGQSFLDFLDLMADGGGFDSWEERAAYSVACHGAVRAGKTLTSQEMSELVRRLEECLQPHTCPHGRPTMLHLSSSHLEREFGRT